MFKAIGFTNIFDSIINYFSLIHCSYVYFKLVDGYDTSETNTEFLRGKIGIVAQEPTLFDDTIGNNIRYGDLSREGILDIFCQSLNGRKRF